MATNKTNELLSKIEKINEEISEYQKRNTTLGMEEQRELSAMNEALQEIREKFKPHTKEQYLCALPLKLNIHVAPEKLNWYEAMEYAKSIGMRLPTKFELQAIVESTDNFNYLDWCWSSSALSSNTTLAWHVYLGYGDTYTNNKTNGNSVLCVAP